MNSVTQGIWEKGHSTNMQEPSISISEENAAFVYQKQPKIRLMHVTPEEKFRDIVKQGQVFASGGCLVAGVYCTPVLQDLCGLRLHNLGSYYLKNFSTDVQQRSAHALLIEINNTRSTFETLGLNYLHLGGAHWAYFKKFNKSQFKFDCNDFLAEITRKIVKSKNFILQAQEISNQKLDMNLAIKQIEEINKASDELPILGNIIFEATSKFIMERQNDECSIYFRQRGEIYNRNYKSFFYEEYPFLQDSFDLFRIRMNPVQMSNRLREMNVISGFDADEFVIYLCKEIIRMFADYIVKGITEQDFLALEKHTMTEAMSNIFGHVINKELKVRNTFGFLQLFELSEARGIWEYWVKNKALIIYNSIYPKGELCINPSLLSQCKYNIYDCKVDNASTHKDDMYISSMHKLNVEIVPQIVPYHESTHR